jgi:hypothetical protein
LSRTSISKGGEVISRFLQTSNWEKWGGERILFPDGLKCKIALPKGVQVLSRGVHYMQGHKKHQINRRGDLTRAPKIFFLEMLGEGRKIFWLYYTKVARF